MIQFGRDICGNLNSSETREWLVTNSIGGFASGTIAGIMTRRYHGLLIAAVQPPTERMYLVSQLNESVVYDEQSFPLYTNRWAGGVVTPNGYLNIERFYLAGTTPVWEYAFADALLEKRIWMQHGANTTYVQYKLLRGSLPLRLNAKIMVNYRDIHSETRADDWQMQIDPVEDGLKVTAYAGAIPIYVLSDKANLTCNHDWHRRYFLMREANRGHQATEDHLDIGEFETTLHPDESVTFTLTTEVNPTLDGDYAYQLCFDREKQLLEQSISINETLASSEALKQIVLAADQFIVSHPVVRDPSGNTIMTGYHWFEHSIRETVLNIPGLLIANGRTDIAGKLLRKYAFVIDQGMLPDRYTKNHTGHTFTSLSTTLWYIEAIRAYYEATSDKHFVRELFPVLQDIIAWLNQGTHHNIHADPADGLLTTKESNLALTWMNAQVNNQPVTPRSGKPIEINALWYNALCIVNEFAGMLAENGEKYLHLAEKVRTGFNRFWNEALSCCFDFIDGPNNETSAQIRPNQLFAVSLPFTPLSPEQQKGVVDICARHLITSHGIRTLSPHDADYITHFGGDTYQRETAYHQGTVWGGLIGPFILAHFRVYKDKSTAASYLLPLYNQLSTHGLGTLSEIFDGNPPFTPHGGIACAWSVASLLDASLAIK
jgi:predicted glycogen debranching enzyme